MARFEKGKSGNPGGKAKDLPGFTILCREWAIKYGLKFLQNLAANSNDEKIRLAATEYLVNRGFGKPSEKIEHSGGMTLEQIIAETKNEEK